MTEYLKIIDNTLIYAPDLTVLDFEISPHDNSDIHTIVLPDKLENFSDFICHKCEALTSLQISKDNPNFVSVDGVIFSKDLTTLYYYPPGKTENTYIIPSTVTKIGDNAFANCKHLKTMEIPDNVTTIGNGSFSYSSICSIVIPDSVTYMGESALSLCENLISIKLPKYMKSISSFLCAWNDKLTTVVIPEGVTEIGDSAFSGCTSLKNINIPNTVKTIGFLAFEECEALTKIVIPDSVTEIEDSAFDGCVSLEFIELGDGISTIKMCTFKNCCNLKRLYFGKNIFHIAFDAFEGVDLKKIKIKHIDNEYISGWAKENGVRALNSEIEIFLDALT